jgi:hypothetical protein
MPASRVVVSALALGLLQCVLSPVAMWAQSGSTPAPAPQQGDASSRGDAQEHLQMASKLAEQQRVWDEIASHEGNLVMKESNRTKTPTATVITYDLFAPALPKEKRYTLVRWPLNGGMQAVRTGVTLGNEGRLLCAGKTPEECKVKEGENPQIAVKITFAKGEASRWALMSEDQASKALASLIPFPLVAQDKGCTLEAKLVTSDARVLMVTASGLPAGGDVPIVSSSAGVVASATWHMNENGKLNAVVVTEVPGKDGGDFSLQLKGSACEPAISLKWGKDSYHAE